VYIRSFADSDGDGIGDLAGIRSRLGHLSDLGVDLVWITPFYPSPGFDHGYDVADYCAVDPVHGTLGDFDDLVAEAHRLGLRVMIDIVPNHSSSAHPWFQAAVADPTGPYRDYYHWLDPAPGGGPPNNWVQHFGGPAWTLDEASGQYYLHLFLPEQPDLNWANPAVLDEFDSILRFWCERGVDGFRIDVAGALVKDPWYRDNPQIAAIEPGMDPIAAWRAFEHRYDVDQNPTVAIYRRWRRVVDPHGVILLGETGPDDPVRLARYHDGGRALHHNFFLWPVRTEWSPLQMRDALRGIHLASPDSVAWTIENHDSHRAATRFGGGELGRRRALALTTLLMGLGGMPFVYQGQELGSENGVVAGGALADPISTRNPGATSGRDGARTPMAWDDSDANGFTTGGEPWLRSTPRLRGDTVAGQRGVAGSWLEAHRRLIALRHQLTDLVDAPAEWLDPDSGLLMAVHRASVLVVCNLDEHDADLVLPDGRWSVVFASRPDPPIEPGAAVTVPAETALILVAG
jgi:alpha-glucosidase